jgi:hypothetical protein
VVFIPPEAPQLSVSTSGLDLSLSWNAVPDATGYILNYAPSPYSGPKSFTTMDVGTDTSFSATLRDGAAFTVAAQAYNDQGVSFYSNIESFVIEQTPPDIPEIPFAIIDWRTRESRSDYRVEWLSLPESIEREDVADLRLVNSQGETVLTIGDFKFESQPNAVFMNCLSGACATAEGINDKGYLANASDLPTGTYTYVLDTTSGATLSKEVVCKGQVLMPVISGLSVATSWNEDGSLYVEWVNPTNDPNWGLVKQFRINLRPVDGESSFKASFLTGYGNSITIPASDLALAFDEADLSSLRIRMQTRAIDAEGFHYARGLSDWINVHWPL